ncbi:hypothetical protein AUJ16_03010 [Candidatus Micrarchaeota archaeon CG1_02_60_51]|nr:MAG: hypothetical protein AUJ16_03010 [Candidatus Micrarchaeota archaeon CG1_02_60_51]PIY91754.1 MAG: hypothetical protein COY71_01465 [Candidatus Micrarchaeota archaeon CG_4_10_14_0_8_um_filter_60_7]
MRQIWLSALILSVLVSGFAYAEGGLFNYGAMQQSKVITVEPGNSATAKIFIFNVHGNRATHVHAEVLNAPPGFTVTLIPASHKAEYNVSGLIMTSEENLVAEPTDIDSLPTQKPETAAEGTEWITMGGVDGFVPAKVLLVNVTADAGLPLWTDYALVITTTANWYDVASAGPVSMGQARDFTYTVRTVTKEYSEEEVANPQAGADFLQGQNLWFYSTVALILLVVGLLAYQLLKKPTRR